MTQTQGKARDMAQAHGRTGAERWQDMQDRAARRARTQAAQDAAQAHGCGYVYGCDVCGPIGERMARRRAVRVRGVVRFVAIVVAAWAAWQVAGIVADGAVAGIGGAQAQAATVPDVATDPPSTFLRTVARCVAIDTGANVATMGRMRYRYADRDGMRWQAGTPAHVRTLAQAAIDLHATTGHRGPYVATACARVTVPA